MPQLPVEVSAQRESPTNINPAQAGVTGTNASSPGSTNGSNVTSLQNTNNTISGTNALQSSIGASLEAAGFTAGQVQSMTNAVVGPAAGDKASLDSKATTPADPAVSAPKQSETSPAEVSAAKKKAMGGGTPGGSAFPKAIASAAEKAYIKIQFETVTRTDAQTPGSKGDAEMVLLPLPENFQTDFNVTYDTVDTGATGAIASQLGAVTENAKKAALARGENQADVGDIVEEALKGAFKGATDIATRTGYGLIDSAESAIGGGVGGAAGASGFIQKALGQIPNPHPSVFFKGMPLRQFQFAWKLVPLSSDDAGALKDVLKMIKKHILPAIDGNTLVYPHLAQITIEGQGSERYDKYMPCFVESMSINYSGEGTSAFFKDGAPVSVFLTMQFRESEMFTMPKEE
jgi:hypothetical protein